MNKKLGTLVLAGTFILTTAIPMTVLAGPGGRMNGQSQQIRTQPKQQIRDQQRLPGWVLPGSGPERFRSGAEEGKYLWPWRWYGQ